MGMKNWNKFFRRKIRTHKSVFNFNNKQVNDIVDFGDNSYKFDGKRWLKSVDEDDKELEVSDSYTTNDTDSFASSKALYDLNTDLSSDIANRYTKAETDTKIVELSPPATKAHVDSLNVDAGTLDGLDSSQFLRSDTAQTVSGDYTFTGDNFTISQSSPQLKFNDVDEDDFTIHINSNNFYILPDRDSSGDWESPYALQLEADTNTGYCFGGKIWTSSNDGSGSGLDADKLDGLDSSQFLRSDTNDNISAAQVTISNELIIQNGNGSQTHFAYNDGGSENYIRGTRLDIDTTNTYFNKFVTFNDSVRINANDNSSNIYMHDGDEGERRIHCNSNRIGFLNQSNGWGSYCDDSGNWHAPNMYGTFHGDGSNLTGIDSIIKQTSAPSASNGDLWYDTDDHTIFVKSDGDWVEIVSAKPDGSTCDRAATSGYQLKQDNPGLPSGNYKIKPGGTNPCITMYVDMTANGGGYDFYAVNGGSSSDRYNHNYSCPAGTDLAMPRSKQWWDVAFANYGSQYFDNFVPIYRTSGGGNFTGHIFRSSHYGSNVGQGWRCKDGGRWWLRDSTFSEPNGDYTEGDWLGGYDNKSRGSGNIGWNDSSGGYSTGGEYLCSTNVHYKD